MCKKEQRRWHSKWSKKKMAAAGSDYYIAGIGSFGTCDDEGLPSVFTHISLFVPWIRQNLESELVSRVR